MDYKPPGFNPKFCVIPTMFAPILSHSSSYPPQNSVKRLETENCNIKKIEIFCVKTIQHIMHKHSFKIILKLTSAVLKNQL